MELDVLREEDGEFLVLGHNLAEIRKSLELGVRALLCFYSCLFMKVLKSGIFQD